MPSPSAWCRDFPSNPSVPLSPPLLSSPSSPLSPSFILPPSPPPSSPPPSPHLSPSFRIPLESILRASRIYEVLKETPLDPAPVLSEQLRNNIYLKREDLLPVFSFKLRGAFNKMAGLTASERARGVTACSAGNHAQGVAYSARHLGISAKIFMPLITPSIKVDSVKRLGGEVVLVGNNFDETSMHCKRCVEEENRVLVHPFDDLEVIAGQATIGLELLKQHPRHIDAIFVAVGGGGIIAGVGSAIKTMNPKVKIVGVEADDAPSMTRSLIAGEIVTLQQVGTFADGAAVRRVGENTFKICQEGGAIDEMVLCSTDEICGGIKSGFTDLRVILEPAGALAIAGMKKYIEMNGCVGKTFVAICSGANTDFERLRFISARADTSEHLLSLVLPERPGMFRKMYDIIFPRTVTEFSYRISETPEKESEGKSVKSRAFVLMSYRCCPGVKYHEDLKRVEAELTEAGFRVIDLASNELAKVHGRHLVGGRSPAATDELLLRFEFPERPGSLRKFLHSLSTDWNVSLFHYRNHGADVGRVLVGLMVDQRERGQFKIFLEDLRSQGFYCVDETANTFYEWFLKWERG